MRLDLLLIADMLALKRREALSSGRYRIGWNLRREANNLSRQLPSNTTV